MSAVFDIISRINERYPQLRDAEKKVADTILNDLTFAAHASITELANKASVSEASITRFAKAMGCRNVRVLKIQLAQSLGVGQRFLADTVQNDSKGISAIYESIKNTLDYNAPLVHEQTVNEAAQTLDQARQILVFGVGGGSTALALETQYRLFRLGMAVTAYSDPVLMRMVASTIEANDAIFCLSLSGTPIDVIESVRIARQYGGKVITITHPSSPLARLADTVLPLETRETDYIFEPSASRYAMLAAIDIVATQIAKLHTRKSREKLRRLKHNLDHYRNAGDRLPLGD